MAEERTESIATAVRLAVARLGLSLAGRLPDAARERWSRSKFASIPRGAIRRIVGTAGPGVYKIEAGAAKGLKIKTDLRFYRGYILGTYEPEVTKRVIEAVKPGMTCLDIGAHHGYYTLLLSLLAGEGGRVYGFEPEEQNYLYLMETIRLNGIHNVECINLAVTEESGVFTLFCAESSSMHKVIRAGGNSDGNESDQIEAVSIDEFVEDRGIKSIDFVKIDVEGSENEVLAGMAEALGAFKPTIICEFHSSDNLNAGLSVLGKQGYESAIFLKKSNYWVFAEPAEAG